MAGECALSNGCRQMGHLSWAIYLPPDASFLEELELSDFAPLSDLAPLSDFDSELEEPEEESWEARFLYDSLR